MGTNRALKAAISLTGCEANFAQAINTVPLTDMLKWNDFKTAQYQTKYRTDEDEANFANAETEHEVEEREGSLSRKLRASVESIASFVTLQLGNVSSSGSNPNYTHIVKDKLVQTLNPKSFAYIEGEDYAGGTGTFTGYKGNVVDQNQIEIDGHGAIMQTVGLKNDGSETDESAFAFPTASQFTAVNRLLGSMATLQYGPSGGALTDITSLLETCKITLASGITIPKRASGGVYVAEYQFGDKHPKLAISFVIKADKGHDIYKNYNGTSNKAQFSLLLQKSVNRSLQLVCSQVVLAAKHDYSGQEPTLEVTVMPEANATDGSASAFSAFKWTFKTGAATYLVAA